MTGKSSTRSAGVIVPGYTTARCSRLGEAGALAYAGEPPALRNSIEVGRLIRSGEYTGGYTEITER